jgi:ferric-dicitrate binding protein FerR (iron transport regulator)
MKEAAMGVERFSALAEIYGADLRRWPADERPAAEALMAAAPEATRDCLADADRLDALLGASRNPLPSPALRSSILAGAPKPRRRGFFALGFWLSGAGLAAAGVAGVLLGVAASSAALRDIQADAVLAEVMPGESVDLPPISQSSQGGMI